MKIKIHTVLMHGNDDVRIREALQLYKGITKGMDMRYKDITEKWT